MWINPEIWQNPLQLNKKQKLQGLGISKSFFSVRSLNEIDGASFYWYAEKKEGCPYEKETVALPEPAPADRLCRGSIHDANAKKTQTQTENVLHF